MAGIAKAVATLLLGSLLSSLCLADEIAKAHAVAAAPGAVDAATVAAAQRLFRAGVLPDGKPLEGVRQEMATLQGSDAACVRCHRRSGLGTAEGKVIIPPITGKYLFKQRGLNLEDMDKPHVSNKGRVRPPYTVETLARAIREGIGSDGTALNMLMPRYPVDDATLQGLVGYLGQLTSQPVPGVSSDTLRFATIVTPDADPAAREGMLAVMRQFLVDRNHIIAGEARPMKENHHGVMFRVTRRWELDVWELTGAPDTWEKQLEDKLEARPVFAVISGLAGRTWAPVHAFCEQRGLPCLLPNTELPVVNEGNFYPAYFSRGVLLEADLLRARIAAASPSAGIKRVVQVYRQDDIGSDAAAALRKALATVAVESVDRALPATREPGDVARALTGLANDSAVVLWLRPGDLAALPAAAPAAGPAIYFSGLMGDFEKAPLPTAWRAAARMTYPMELPEKRRVAMSFPTNWFNIKHIPITSERVQVHTYLACQILSETLGEMLDSFERDYLVERLEVMLSHRLVNTYYPRLSLGQDQRFASKGGYLVRFVEPQGTQIAADGEWTTP